MQRIGTGWRLAGVAFAALVVTGAVVALARTGPGGDGSSTKAASSALPGPSARGDAMTSSAPDAKAAGAASEVASTVPSAGPSIVRTAELRVQVRDHFAAAVDRATSVAGALGGFVTTSTSSLEDGRSSADLTIRIPANRFDEARHRLGDLGTLESSTIGGNDVGGQLVDLDARLKTLRSEEGALDALLGSSKDIGQILQIRDRLTGVRTQIEQLAGQQAALADQVALATVHVVLHQPGVTPTDPDATPAWDLGRSVEASWHAALAVAGGMVVVVGVLAPFALLALVALPFVLRRRRALVTD